jgi:hypothetical protein
MAFFFFILDGRFAMGAQVVSKRDVTSNLARMSLETMKLGDAKSHRVGESAIAPPKYTLRPSVRASPDHVARLLADEFIEFGSSCRVYDKREIIELLQHEQARVKQRTVADFSARRLAADVFLLTLSSSREPNDKKLNLAIRRW